MTSRPSSRFWIGATVYLQHDDSPGVIIGVLFVGDPCRPTVKYIVAWTSAENSEHYEVQLTTDKTVL